MDLDHLSLATTPVVALRSGEPAWQGSGFFYIHTDEETDRRFLYLVTSLHVLTGSPPGVAEGGAINEIVFQFHLDREEPARVRPVRAPLYTRDGRRAWLQSEATPVADIAVLPIPPDLCEGLTLYCIDESWARAGDSGPGILASVHTVGFPYGCHDRRNALPLWQTGTLVSEPGVDFDGEPCLRLETPPYPGTAGAPVLSVAEHRPRGAASGLAQPVRVHRLLGVFATPMMDSGNGYPEAWCDAGSATAVAREAGMHGTIWRASVIDEVVRSVNLDRWGQEVLAALA